MRDDTIRYSAGGDARLNHAFHLDLVRSGMDETKADYTTRFLEFWCQSNCRGIWRIEETGSDLRVFFSTEHDVVLFMISAEAAEHKFVNKSQSEFEHHV